MDFDYVYEFTSDSWPRARKRHTCDACGEVIQAGDRYWRFAGGSREHGVEETKQCARCNEIYEHLKTLPMSGGEGPDMQLNCGHEYEELHDEPPPETIAAMAFATRAEMQTLLAARKQVTQ